MKTIILLTLFLTLPLLAEPTEERTWTASNGKTVIASATTIENGKVSLKKSTGSIVQVPISTFIESDQELLKKHFAETLAKEAEPKSSGAEPATGLPYPQGKVVGPIDSKNQASYFLYLPKSLKKNRKAPILFYTHSGGGSQKLIDRLSEGAETCGWVLAISKESKNKRPFKENVQFSKRSLEHIFETLPVDRERVYFTGNSGGGATSFANSATIKNLGAMPNVAYIPLGFEPKSQHYFIIGGGADYNRYASAVASKDLGKNAIHRMHPGGHGVSPNWLYIDGMIWFQTKFLATESQQHPDEAKDFEASMIDWLNTKKTTEPYRAYATVKMILKNYKPSAQNASALETIEKELAQTQQNILYYEALEDINQLSKEELSTTRGGSHRKHISPKATKAAQKLLPKYQGVPIIEETLKAIAGKTQ